MLICLSTKNAHILTDDACQSDPGGARTHDPNIKSVVLYQLSYEIKEASTLRRLYRRENSLSCLLT